MKYKLLLDLSSLAYRAFFALPSSITAPDGRPVNSLRGYLDMTANLVVARAPDEVIHVLDADWRPAERVAAYAGYKARREPEPEALSWQLVTLPNLLLALGHQVVEAPGWEADDALAVMCAAAAPGDRIDVVTGDRDLIQLVRDPVVRVLFTVKGVSELAVFDEAAVEERYGVPAARYGDFAILRGDPSDGLPGVPGVGEKTARRLVADYSSLDELLAAARGESEVAAGLTPKLAARLTQAADYLAAMRDVVPLRADVALRLTPGKRDDVALEDAAARWNLEGPLRRLRAAMDALRPEKAAGREVAGE